MISFFRSFRYAFNGLVSAIKGERNLRFHLVATCYAFWLSYMFSLPQTEMILLVLTVSLVISLELVNTSLEYSQKNPSPHDYEKAGVVKDVAAAAVLVAAFGAAAVGVLLFFKINELTRIALLLVTEPIYAVLFVISLVLSFLFVFIYKGR